MRLRALAVPAAFLCAAGLRSTRSVRPDHEAPRVAISDNRHAAGALRDGILALQLTARLGTWHPDADSAPGAEVQAFAEAGGPPQVPGPLIRVAAGTEIRVTVRNDVPNGILTVHGLHARPLPAGAAPGVVQVPPGESREVRFRLGAPGTYHYWGTTTGRALIYRAHEDAQLSGAIVVDEPGRTPPPDRILMIGMWADTAGPFPPRNRRLFVVNGRSWPHTERLSYTVADTVRMRVLNVTADAHPMHLHGFFFEVTNRGDGRGDTAYAPEVRDREVTERMLPGETIAMEWVPERGGNWLFHCHIPNHIGPKRPLGVVPGSALDTMPAQADAGGASAMSDMSGLVVGITVRPRSGETYARDVASRRRLRLLARVNTGSTPDLPAYGFALQDGDVEPPPDSGHRAGPPIVLTRGEPVAITVVNRTPEPTSVHWHGIELESYYDGVAGYSGHPGRIAPVIAPGDSFEARFTPPRAGTFIYHTHVDELRQEPAGLSGPIVVLEPGARYDTATDRSVLISTPGDPTVAARAVLLNGSLTPPAFAMRTGATVRLRLVNITIGRPLITVRLARGGRPVAWRMVARDGAALASARIVAGEAVAPLSIGQTADVELTPGEAGEMRLEVVTATGAVLGVLPLLVIAS